MCKTKERNTMNCPKLLAFIVASLLTGVALADNDTYILTIQNHRFEPAEITLPANTRVKLLIKNLDPTPEEFESYELNREKIITGGAEAVVYIGPVPAGRYPFFGEFNQSTAQGVIVAK